MYVDVIKIEDKSQEAFIKKRTEMAQKLFNKINLYQLNSEERKKRLLGENVGLLKAMEDNDKTILKSVKQMKNVNEENAELILTLNSDNEIIKNKMTKCEYLNNLNSKCYEMGKI